MGEVYRARDLTLKRDIAIKVLPDVFSSDCARHDCGHGAIHVTRARQGKGGGQRRRHPDIRMCFSTRCSARAAHSTAILPAKSSRVCSRASRTGGSYRRSLTESRSCFGGACGRIVRTGCNPSVMRASNLKTRSASPAWIPNRHHGERRTDTIDAPPTPPANVPSSPMVPAGWSSLSVLCDRP